MSIEERNQLRRKVRRFVLEALRDLGNEGTRQKIIARAEQLGEFSDRELTTPSPPGHRSQYPRLIDHDMSWALTDLKRDGLLENPRRNTWRLTARALVNTEPASEEVIPAWRLAELQAMSYREYLRTTEWRRTRAAALVRAGYSCALDPAHTENLEVHHRTYERLGAERASDLIVLCHPCHMLHHKENGRPRRSA